MTEKPLFLVELRPFEPHTLRSGRGHRNLKRELRDAIMGAMDGDDIAASREKLRGRILRIDVEFRLWRGAENVSNTRAKKDLDNLLKPVMDVLQTSLNTQRTELGLGLIEDDESVHEINTRKVLVNDEMEEGIRIAIHDRSPVG